MNSNCYVVYDEDSKRCLVIDPASEKSLNEIQLIEELDLHLDYIILTHEHTDHNWGVNALREHFHDAKLVCSGQCNKNVKKTNRAYFLFYYDDPDYRYEIASADILINKQEEVQALMLAAQYLPEEYITEKVLTIFGDGDRAEEILQQITADNIDRLNESTETGEVNG